MVGIKAILFDLDDTLYPERDFVFSGFRAVSEWVQSRLGLPSDSCFRRLQELFREGVRKDTFNVWLAECCPDRLGMVADLVQVYRNHIPRISPYSEVVPVLSRLRDSYVLGLVTDGLCDVQERKLAALDLTHLLSAVVFSDSLGIDAWKPSPVPYKAALAELGVQAFDAVYVGDNPLKDFLGARRAGLWSIRVQRPECEHSDKKSPSPSHAPDTTIETFNELGAALAEIERQRGKGR